MRELVQDLGRTPDNHFIHFFRMGEQNLMGGRGVLILVKKKCMTRVYAAACTLSFSPSLSLYLSLVLLKIFSHCAVGPYIKMG